MSFNKLNNSPGYNNDYGLANLNGIANLNANSKAFKPTEKPLVKGLTIHKFDSADFTSEDLTALDEKESE